MAPYSSSAHRSDPSSKKFLFAIEGNKYRKSQLFKMQRTTDRVVSSHYWYIYNTNPAFEDQETLQERWQKKI